MPPSLAELLQESTKSVRHREAHAMEDLLSARGGRIVLFGCGGLGRRAVEKLRELDVQPLALCDNNASLWGTEMQGIPVLSVDEAAARFGADALFMVAVWNPHHWIGETAQQLKAAGAQAVISYHPLFWRFPNDLLPVRLLNDAPSKVYQAKREVLAVEALWGDELSLRIYRANIYWRALGDPQYMPARPIENTYFPPDLFKPVPDECVLDCGAYDGDTVRQIVALCGARFAAIYSLEGDAVSFEILRQTVAALPDELAKKIHPIHGAVGGERTVVRFSSDGGTGSKMDPGSHAGVAVQCYPLDELPVAESVTMIKMDIEGAEYDSLHGASRMIARDKPLLAICVYHTQNDIWRIPLLVHDMLPDHLLFLRAYEGDGFQTVMYAVPQHRLLPDAERVTFHAA